MTYANMGNVPTQTAGVSPLLASDWNTYVKDNFNDIKAGHVVCTSSTRPSGVVEGTMIYETDSNKVLVYNGVSWVEVSDLDNAGGLSDAAKAAGGDLTGSFPSPTIANNAVTTVKIADSSSTTTGVTSSKLRWGAARSVIGTAGASAAAVADISATSGSNGVLRESGGSIGFGLVGTNNITDLNVTTGKLADNAVTTPKIDITAASAPSGTAGDVYYNTTDKTLNVHNGTSWVSISDLDNVGAMSNNLNAYVDSYAVQFRNVIMNGAMQVAQRATSVASISTSGTKTADRWYTYLSSLGTWTQSVEPDGPSGSGFANSLKMLCTTANASPAASNYANISQFIEMQNLQHFAKGTASAKKFALQFWVKSNKTGVYTIELSDALNNRQISATYNVNVSDTWEKKTIVFVGDASGVLSNTKSQYFAVRWWLGAGTDYTSGTLNTSNWATTTTANTVSSSQVNLAAASNNYWQITGVQLEAGDYNTPFEFEPYDVTLRKCYRYYYKIGNYNPGSAYAMGTLADGTNGFFVVNFPVTMWGNCSMTSSSTANEFGVHAGSIGYLCTSLPFLYYGTPNSAVVAAYTSSSLPAYAAFYLYAASSNSWLAFSSGT